MKQVAITSNFDQRQESLLGVANFDEASALWDLFCAHPESFVFAPAYEKHDDGTIELLEISMVPIRNVVKSKGGRIGQET